MSSALEVLPADALPDEPARACWPRAESRDGAEPPGDASLADGIVLLLVLTIPQRLIGFCRNVLFCRLLEPDQLGEWNLAFNMLLIGAPLIVLGLPGSFGRYVEHYRQRNQLRTFLRRTTAASLLLAATGIGLLALLHEPLSWLIFADRSQTDVFAVALLALAAVVSFNFLVELLTALRQVRAVSLMQLANSLIFAVVAVTLLVTTALGARGILLGYAAACLLTSAAAGWRLRGWITARQEEAPLTQFELWRKLAPFAAWLWVSDLLMNLFSAVDRYMIMHFCCGGPQEAAALVGHYHSSRVVGDLLVGMSIMLGAMVLPYLSHDWESGRRRAVSQRLNLTLKLTAVGMSWLCGLVLVGAPLLFDWALGGKYANGREVLPWMLICCIWFGMILLAKCYLWCAERARLVSCLILTGLLTNAVLNLLWLPRWGLWGAVLATAVSHAVVLVLVFAASRLLGARQDGRVWLACALPACLSLGTGPALALLVAVTWLGVSRGWLFSRREVRDLKTLFTDQWHGLRGRGGHRSSNPWPE